MRLSNHKNLNFKPIAKDGGFGATIAVVMVSMGALSLSMAAVTATAAYVGSVEAKISRIQKSLDARACADSIVLMRAKGYLNPERIEISEFGCRAGM